MRRVLLWVVALDLGVLLVLGLVLPDLMVGPGPVADAHHAFARDCFACHRPWAGPDSRRCVGCHQVATIGVLGADGAPLRAPRLKLAFHQNLLEHDCIACHAEHRGVQRALAARVFSHQLIGEPMRERCESCHRKPDDSGHRRLSGKCANCHVTEYWTPAGFDHQKQFPLDAVHDVDCSICHRDNVFGRTTCYGCHAHTPAGMRAAHADEGIQRLDECAACHRATSGGRRERAPG